MAKAGRGSDQFPLRLPDGMRDRIAAAAAKHERSMNAEIVSVLELHYPEPFSLDKRMHDLMVITSALQQAPKTELVEAAIGEIEKVLEGMAYGKMPSLSEDEIDKMRELLHAWQSHKNDDYSERVHKWLDEAGESDK